MASAMQLFLFALLGFHAAGISIRQGSDEADGVDMLKPKAKEKSRALLATMVMPDDEIPVDLMLEHHMRMLTGNMSTLEAAIIDNHPPWDERKSSQEPLLARYRRSQGATGNVQVKSVNYTKMSELLQRFFGQSPLQLYKNHPKALQLFRKDAPANLSRMDPRAKAARLLGMMHFMELCQDAEADIDMCIFMDSTSFVYRESETGIVELAQRFFRKEPNAVVLQPPDLCTYTRTSERGVCKLGNTTGIYHGFMVINRDRFEGFAPMAVDEIGLSSSFEDLLAEGLTKGGVEGAVRRIRCGGTFAINPYDATLGRYACQAPNAMGLSSLAKSMTSRRHKEAMRNGFSADYARFQGGAEAAQALQALIDRFESGKFPEAKYPDSVTNKCLNMCPSRERVSQGLAW
mmetsp:Transcript_95647/g.270639  ORF Transcript_95647/g.270639 Transcript_95647/m.270639 type:complete len:403 (+) Transcript_95647:62-1270(+)